ncbi:MAG: hypothetical protein BWZ10_03164 [candidate division BRC1 bacterium ADurb.BinA364]|nr:MAG: hypothetical protein BWZ10_03164 [candidate division BRC1 bacterium ADurb.BinA364]
MFNYRANRWRDLARNEQESQEDKLHRLGPDDANPLDGSVFVRVAVMRDQGETGVAKMRMPRAAFAGMAL